MSILFSSSGLQSASSTIFGPGSHLTSYYLPQAHTTTGVTQTITSSALFCYPIVVPKLTTFASIGMEVTTTAASSSIRLGVYYENETSGGPGLLHTDCGTIDTASSTGEKTIAFTTPLCGRLWLVCCTSAHTPTMRSFGSTSATSAGYVGSASQTTSSTPPLRRTSSSSYFSALPSDLTGDAGSTTTTRPIIFLKF